MATLDELIGSWSLSLRAADRSPRTVAHDAGEPIVQFRRWVAAQVAGPARDIP